MLPTPGEHALIEHERLERRLLLARLLEQSTSPETGSNRPIGAEHRETLVLASPCRARRRRSDRTGARRRTAARGRRDRARRACASRVGAPFVDDQRAAGHAEVDEQRLRRVGLDQQVLAVTMDPRDRRAGELRAASRAAACEPCAGPCRCPTPPRSSRRSPVRACAARSRLRAARACRCLARESRARPAGMPSRCEPPPLVVVWLPAHHTVRPPPPDITQLQPRDDRRVRSRQASTRSRPSSRPGYVHAEDGAPRDRANELAKLWRSGRPTAAHHRAHVVERARASRRAPRRCSSAQAAEHSSGARGGYTYDGRYTLAWHFEDGAWKLALWTWKRAGADGRARRRGTTCSSTAPASRRQPNKLLVTRSSKLAPRHRARHRARARPQRARTSRAQGWKATGIDFSHEGMEQTRDDGEGEAPRRRAASRTTSTRRTSARRSTTS